MTPERLREHLFGERPYAEALLALDSAEPVGYAIYYFTYSTFAGRPGVYLEDLFVRPEARAGGLGKRLLAQVAAVAVEHGAAYVDWEVLDWNEPAIEFYRRLGAREAAPEWLGRRLEGEALERLASTI